jgi:hypothetical protein
LHVEVVPPTDAGFDADGSIGERTGEADGCRSLVAAESRTGERCTCRDRQRQTLRVRLPSDEQQAPQIYGRPLQHLDARPP